MQWRHPWSEAWSARRSSAYAFDAPEAILTVAFVPLWAAIVPMHDIGLYIFVTGQIVRNVMGHAGVELSPASGRPSRLFGWLNTTTHQTCITSTGAATTPSTSLGGTG